MEKYKVSVVKCSSYHNEEVKNALLESLRLIDFDFKSIKNKKILIKPNILGPYKPEKAITTHPVVIEELCKILKKYHSKIYIGDSSGMFMETGLAIKASGIYELSKYATIINFDKSEKKFIDIGKIKVPVPVIFKEFDFIINIPKMKIHSSTGVTLCVKNIFGCITGNSKGNLHKTLPMIRDFSEFLLKFYERINPQLNIIDGITGLEGEGPGAGGNPINSGLVISSKNAIAADIIASEIMGFNYKDIYTNKLSGIEKNDLEVLGDGKNEKIYFKKSKISFVSFLRPFIKLFPKSKIKFDKEKCIRCLKCEKKCPVQAIKINPEQICNHKECIKCLCCIEVCPEGAVYLEEPWLKKLLRSLKP